MRAVAAKVVKGKVVTRARLPEGARLTVFVHAADPSVVLDDDDERAVARDAAAIRAGKYKTAAELRAFLRRG